MKEIVASPQDSLAWKKFLLLPTVLFTNQLKDRKAILKATLALIEKDDWSSFTYDSFPKRRLAKIKEDDEKQQSKSAEFREHKIDTLAKAGEIGGIMKFILQNRDREVPEDVVLKLRDKHPSPLQELSDQEKQGIIQVDITDSCRELLGITGTRLRTILRKRPKLKRAGSDKPCYDHLQTLIGYGGEQAPDEDEFANLLADILVLLVDVKAPEELYQVLRDNELIALPKKDDDIRPVGISRAIRKLVSILFLSHTFEKPAVVVDSTRKLRESFNDLHFKGLQYGCSQRGTEKIIHFTQ